MSKLVTLAVYSNAFDIKFNLLKELLTEASVPFVTSNEFNRSVRAEIFPQSNIAIEVKVDEDYLEQAVEIFRSIK